MYKDDERPPKTLYGIGSKNPSNPETCKVKSLLALRRLAEKLLEKESVSPPAKQEGLSPEEARRVIHELQVHQIELEAQNEELRRSQEILELLRARYFDLYDLAPVGYFTLSRKGLILEANLTAAHLFGVPRGALAKQLFSHFIFGDDQDIYSLSQKRLFETREPQTLELRLVRSDGLSLWAHLETTITLDDEEMPMCRMALSDISERKRNQEALKQIHQRN